MLLLLVLTAAGGVFGHKDDPKQGAMTCRQGEEAWKPWKASYISLSDGVVEYVKTQDVKRRWAAQVDLQCRQQSLIGKRRRYDTYRNRVHHQKLGEVIDYRCSKHRYPSGSLLSVTLALPTNLAGIVI